MSRTIRLSMSIVCAGFGVYGCATAQLSAGGQKVVVVASSPAGTCENLGTVVGEGGGSFGGGWVSNDKLVQYAMNDMQNKAAARGATHVQASPPQLGGMQGTTTTATVTGIMFRCQPTATP